MKKSVYALFFFIAMNLSICTAKNYYGSIAIDTGTGVVAASYNFSTDNEAKSKAILQCTKKNGGKKGCKTAIGFYNACGAVAWASGSKFAFGEWHDSDVEKAKSKAMYGCRINGGVGCKVVEAVCTAWETEEVIWW